jgi:hypothetical protein
MDIELAQRLHRALTAGGDELLTLFQDPSPEVLQAALKNPAVQENHLLTLLKRRELPDALLKSVCQHPLTADSHPLKVALVQHPNTPGPQLATLLPQLYLFELVTLCYLPGITPDQKLAAERTIIQRLPTTSLGNKLTLARRGTGPVVEALLKEGDSALLAVCLDNPHLKEGMLFQLLQGGRATAESISVVARHPRWQQRPNLKLAILGNPRTPLVWFTHWLPSLATAEIKRLLAAQRLSPQQKREVEAFLKKRS